MCRLNIPHYEEVRLYWSKASVDGSFESAIEMVPVNPYLPESPATHGESESFFQMMPTPFIWATPTFM